MPIKSNIVAMFNDIASDYDRLDHIMSLDIDKRWRKKAISRILDEDRPLQILDLACGTGDFSIAMAEKMHSGHITGADISEGMMQVMREKVDKAGLSEKISIERGDGENLQFEDGKFDRVTIAFGIRNFEDREKGLSEMLRVLKPGGKLVLLELSLPENRFFKWCYDLYFLHIVPLIGGSISGNKSAYKYLPASVVGFPKKKAFIKMMNDAGFIRISHKAFSFGICRMYTGEKAI